MQISIKKKETQQLMEKIRVNENQEEIRMQMNYAIVIKKMIIEMKMIRNLEIQMLIEMLILFPNDELFPLLLVLLLILILSNISTDPKEGEGRISGLSNILDIGDGLGDGERKGRDGLG
ncbi:MAG: hypothetical protein EZS28_017166 [Streblomastix strix]|uniref:Uncharacterized protein n=1 Tax=Streblomastix strix TaxID=222440 RepID=A0A5J4VXL2_9EUKA|nr:MAG: hypothetical protein EZS28_017166 [Streblomastix strix]